MLIPSSLEIILFLFAYLLGSISSAILLCKFYNLPDPRTVYSKNAGATNIRRIGGSKLAFLVLIFDILKGLMPVLMAKILEVDFVYLCIIGLFAFLGHIFPIFFKFKGGKGIATFIGVLLSLNIYSGLIFIAMWLFSAKVLKISSLAALIATLLTPVHFYYLSQNYNGTIVIIIIAILSFISHSENIKRIFNKSESAI